MNPAVAVDAMGNAVVVYQNGNQIWGNHYDAQSNVWGTPGAIDSRNIAQYEPKVAVDKNGIYLAIWYLLNDATNRGSGRAPPATAFTGPPRRRSRGRTPSPPRCR